MASINVSGSVVSSAFNDILGADDLTPGDDPSYELCKLIYLYHPLGGKMTETPVRMALSQKRIITIAGGPEEDLIKAFDLDWEEIGASGHIHNVTTQSRIYGISTIAMLAEGVPTDRPIDPKQLGKLKLSFNVLDPLNTSGSAVLNQNPNALDYQKIAGIVVAGTPYHRSRTVTIMNEKPIYIAYTNSAFGYTGRSVYQRALFPLKTFLQSMITDDMVMKKASVLVAMLKQAGSIVSNVMAKMAGVKRAILKEAKGDNVISIDITEKIESLNLQNLEAPVKVARQNCLENVATAADMPAKILNHETFAEGFGEGTEDAKAVAGYVSLVRDDMKKLFDFFDNIVMYRAWNPEFYQTIQAKYPEEYKGKGYTQAFYEWKNAFKAEWPSLITEPDSEKIKVSETRLKALVSSAEILFPNVDPDNKAKIVEWFVDNLNEDEMLFSSTLELDPDTLREFLENQQETSDEIAKMGARGSEDDSESGTKMPPQPRAYGDSVPRLRKVAALAAR